LAQSSELRAQVEDPPGGGDEPIPQSVRARRRQIPTYRRMRDRRELRAQNIEHRKRF